MSSEMKVLEQSNNEMLMQVPMLRFPEFRDSASWDKKELNKLLTIGSGKDYKHLSMGDIPVYGSGGYMLSVNDYLYDGESVCIGRKGTIDRPIFLTGKFWTVDTLFYTHSFIKCFPKFIFYQFQKINWKKYNEAGGIPSLSKTTIGKIEIPVPSYVEQQKIADCLSSLDNVISLQTQKIGALQRYKKGLMQKLFPAEGETVPELRFSEFLKTPGWEEKTINSLGEVITGNTPSTSCPEYYNGEYLFVSPADISELRFVRETKNTLSHLGFQQTRPIKANSILFVCIGSTIGKIAQNPYECATNQQINSITPNSNFSAGFIYYKLSHNADKISQLAGKQAVPIINKTLFSSVMVKTPALAEQQKIADCLSSLDELITHETQKLAALKTHKTGLMQQLFPTMDEVNA